MAGCGHICPGGSVHGNVKCESMELCFGLHALLGGDCAALRNPAPSIVLFQRSQLDLLDWEPSLLGSCNLSQSLCHNICMTLGEDCQKFSRQSFQHRWLRGKKLRWCLIDWCRPLNKTFNPVPNDLIRVTSLRTWGHTIQGHLYLACWSCCWQSRIKLFRSRSVTRSSRCSSSTTSIVNVNVDQRFVKAPFLLIHLLFVCAVCEARRRSLSCSCFPMILGLVNIHLHF